MRTLRAGFPFIALGVAFIALGAAGSRTFLYVGIVFVVVGFILLARARRPPSA
jgi:glucose dehydrogenase